MLDELKATVCNQGQTDYVILRNEVENYSSYQPLPDEENDALLFGNVIATSIHVWLYWQRNTYAYHQAVLQWSQCFPQQGSY